MIESFLENAKRYISNEKAALTLHNQVDPHCQIDTFETSIRLCKADIAASSLSDLHQILQELCQENEEIIAQLLQSGKIDRLLDLFAHRMLSITDQDGSEFNVNETNLAAMVRLHKRGQKLLHYLKAQHNLQKSQWFSWLKPSINPIKKQIEDIELHIDLLGCRIETDSGLMSENIVAHCSHVYHFLYAILRYAKLTNDIMLEIALNAMIDRILFILEPSLQKHTLKNQYLLYYHVAYELQELRRSILADI